MTRAEVYETWGRVSSDVAAPIINPAFMGGPRWPALRQAWVRIDKPEYALFVSDGLSDPFDDEPDSIGFGHEIGVFCPQDEAAEGVMGGWPLQLAIQVGGQAAHFGNFASMLERYNPFSLELEAGTTVLLGDVPGYSIPLAGGEAKLIAAKLLMQEETELIKKEGAAGRAALKKDFGAGVEAWISSKHRKPAARVRASGVQRILHAMGFHG